MMELDLGDAYNGVLHNIIHNATERMLGMSKEMWIIKWTANALLNKTVALNCKTWTPQPKQIFPGISHGSRLSFSIKIASLAKQYQPPVANYSPL